MKKHLVYRLLLCVVVASSSAFADEDTSWIKTDYASALEASKAENHKPLLIFFQKDGLPKVPTKHLQVALHKHVVAAVPLDHTGTNGEPLLSHAAFKRLDGKPGVIRGTWDEDKLYFKSALAGEKLPLSKLGSDVLGLNDLAVIKGLMPKIEDEHINEIIDSPYTYWYDDDTMPPAYQDASGPYSGLLSVNRTFNSGIAPREFFRDGRFRYPFGRTGGANATRARTVKFLSLPRIDGKRLPVVYWKTQGFFEWAFPIGTEVGEVLILDHQGEPYVFEVRLRTRFKDSWGATAYRPFPTAESMKEAIVSDFSDWEKWPQLVAMMKHLDAPLNPKNRRSLGNMYGVVPAEGVLDVIPTLYPEVTTFWLRNRTFKSAEGLAWKSDEKGLESYAPTTKQNFSIVPASYHAGLLEVHSSSCVQCHRETSRDIGDFVPSRSQYGKVWGSDQIFSFHPFEPGFLDSSPHSGGMPGHEAIRKSFLENKIVAKFNAKIHTEEHYNKLPKYFED